MAVHILEVCVVEAVLAHLLDARLDRVVVRVVGAVSVVAILGDVDELPLRLVARRVVPGEHDAGVLADREGPQAGLAVRAVGVGDLDVGALTVERPPVERATDLLPLDGAAPTQVGTEVRAKRLLARDGAVGVPPDHQLRLEVTPGDERSDRQFVGQRHFEPTERHREREPTTVRQGSAPWNSPAPYSCGGARPGSGRPPMWGNVSTSLRGRRAPRGGRGRRPG